MALPGLAMPALGGCPTSIYSGKLNIFSSAAIDLHLCHSPRSKHFSLCLSNYSPSLDLPPELFLWGQHLRLWPLLKLQQRKSLGMAAQARGAGKEEAKTSAAALQKQASAGKNVQMGMYFVAWWGLHVVFSIYNKKVLNAFPFPWLISALSLAAGSAIMLSAWIARIVTPPDADFDFWRALFPVAVAHATGHVATTVSLSKVAVSFTHIIKSAEPAFSVLISRFLMGERFPVAVYLSLAPIIGGCALAAITELDFNMIGFMGAMISNITFVFRNIFSKRAMQGEAVSGMNYYGCLTILSLALEAPFALAVEGPQLWAPGWQKAVQEIGPHFIWWVVAQSVLYHLYNQVSYMSLDEITPLTFSIGNTMKRVAVIVSSILVFRTAVYPINAAGAAIAILGTFLYSQANRKTNR